MNPLKRLSKKTTISLIIVIAVITAVLMLLLLQPPSKDSPLQKEPPAVQGMLNLENWDLEQDGIVKLKGEWEFYWNQLLTASDFADSAPLPAGQIVQVPNVWTDYEKDGQDYPGKGFATYRLRVQLADDGSQKLALKIPDISTACKIYVDHQLIAECGEVADNEQQAKAKYNPHTIDFSSNSDQFDIIVQVSNYLYDRGGMWYALDLGTEQQITTLRENEMAMNLILLGIFFFMGTYHFAIYLLRPKEKVALFFAFGCFVGVFRLFVIDEIFLLNLYPQASVELITATIYLTYYVGITVLTLYLRELYKQEISRIATRMVVAISALFIVTVLFLPLSLYTHMIRYYHLFMIVVGLYLIYAVLLAVWRKRDGARLQFLGITFFVLTIFHDIFFNLFYISEWINHANTIQFLKRQIVLLGLFVLVFIQAVILARRFSKAFHTVESISEKLISMDRLKDEFLINTSHELKTPLHGIINLSQSMIEGSNGPMNEPQRKNLAVIVSVARRLTNLIQDVMDFSKLKNGEITLNKKTISLAAILNANVEVLRHYINDKPIQLKIMIPEDLPNIYADENRILQILYNLIGNAIKFTEQGTIVVSATQTDNMVEVHVSDTGIGIPLDKQEVIFQSFEQSGAAVSREYTGNGLGLSISKQLVELNGGEISVESKPGVGSTFTFTVPVSTDQVTKPLALHPAKFAMKPQTLKAVASQNSGYLYKILAVDDDPTNLQVLVNVLAQEPYRLLLAQNGDEALRLMENEENIDLVILDVMMPKMSGYEVTRKIRERYSLSELPILLLTVKNEPEDLISAFSAGANDFLTKPFFTHEIKARVRNLLELKDSVEQALQSELSFLRAQIKPHFLYNALNTIIGLCPRDPNKASNLLTELSCFLRGSFDFQSKEKFVALEKEMELVQSYVAIEKARFEERLTVKYEVDEDIRFNIPPLTIQPLVENAIRHGVMKRVEGGTVTVSVKLDQASICITIEDNGVGMPEDKLATLLNENGEKRGVGLANIDQRLKKIYGTGLTVLSKQGQGTKVIMKLPKERSVETAT